jgi:hypothetical protein
VTVRRGPPNPPADRHECSHGIPCYGFAECYAGLKDRFRAGGRLSPDELQFIGMVAAEDRCHDGWRDVDITMPTFELRKWETDAEDAEAIAALMSVGGVQRARFEFMGS